MTGSPSPVQLFRAAQGSPKGVGFEETLYWGPCRLMESDHLGKSFVLRKWTGKAAGYGALARKRKVVKQARLTYPLTAAPPASEIF